MTFHNVINASCYEAIRDIPDNSVDLVIMDPPYDIEIRGGGIVKDTKNSGTHKKMADLAGLESGFDYSILRECERVCKVLNLYIFCSLKQIKPILNYFEDVNYDILTWHKTNSPPFFKSAYMPDTEYIIFIRGAGAPWYGTYATAHKYWVSTNSSKKRFNHPTVKPDELVQRFILNSSKEGDVVLDPFAGSGTTAANAKLFGRNSISIEINKEYCDIIKNRLGSVLSEVSDANL